MRIVAFVHKNSSPAYHRVIVPLMLMKGVDVHVTNSIDIEHNERLIEFLKGGVDLFMYNRIFADDIQADTEMITRVNNLKEKYGCKVCVDVDDYWHLDEHHILFPHYEEIQFAKRQIDHLYNADVVLTTNERLAEVVKPFNKNVHVCPNAIPHQGQFDIEREPHYLTRLFWQGSITHRKDIEILERPIDQLSKISPKIKMIMAGYHDTEDEWYSMAMTYTAQGKHQYKLIKGAKVTEYYEAYKHADICLIPLVKSRFNGYKSNLKVLEAANLGLPVIASQVDPYLNLPLLYAKCGNDWVKHITRLVESKKRRKEAGAELKEFVDTHFNFHKINNERKQILEYESKKVSV